MRKRFVLGMAILLLPLILTSVNGDEGLWPFNMVPVKVVKQKYGFTLTPEWTRHFQLSCVNMRGSASFVSPDGLYITNHHVGARAIHNLSSKENDYIKNGFYAPTRDKELKCPGLSVKVLVGIEDVTQKVQGAVKQGMSTSEAGMARQKMIGRIEKNSAAETGLRSEVVTLYAGAMYHLYQYKTYDDVRLVFAPENDAAKFGGDPDNYGFPRYSLDVAFFRVYEDGKPLHSKNYLRWNRSGVEENELVFCSGNPAFTYRMLTNSQMDFLRDVKYPLVLKKYIRQRDHFTEFSKEGAEQTRVAGRDLWGALNEVKCFTGMLSGLNNEEIMSVKRAEEKMIRKAVAANPELNRKYGKAWDEIAAAQKVFASFYKEYYLFVEGQGFRSQYIWNAERLLDLAETESTEARESIKSRIFTQRTYYKDFEIARLAQSLALLQEELAAHSLVKKILGKAGPAEAARKIIEGSRIDDPEYCRKLANGPAGKILSSDDAAIRLVKMIAPFKKELARRYAEEVQAVERQYGAQIARVIFEVKGPSMAPDATGTLRLSYGVVKSYTEDDGTFIPYYTTFEGLYKRSDKTGNKPPYNLTQRFIDARDKIDMSIPYNFAATCDASGGNSGSPLVNKKGEFIGILFDGNRQSLPHRFLYSDKQVRSVMVHAHGIIETLRKIYNAGPLVKELLPD